jgi:hypothetical protein
MRRVILRAGIICAAAALLAACLDDSEQSPRLSLSRTTVSLSASPGDAAPIETIPFTIEHAGAGGVFMDAQYSGDGITSLVLTRGSAATGDITAEFVPPSVQESGTYVATITIRACVDETCTRHLEGSPATITTSYEISETGISTASLDRDLLEHAAYTDDSDSPVETLQITLNPAPASTFYVYADKTHNQAVLSIDQTTFGQSTSDLEVIFYSGSQTGPGTFEDTITITVCYDPGCMHPVEGSPFTVAARLTVEPASERGLEPLEFESRVELGHDVIDAEFSKPLDALVMVSANPVNAIYVLDTATGVERRRNLVKAPTSVSVAPDGLTAAVGHDALISIVDLANAGVPGTPAPKRLDVSTNVFDIVLDGAGYVHAFPLVDQWQAPHSVEIATNIETLGTPFLYAGARARLAPGTTWIYTADNGLSPSDIAKWNIASGTAQRMYDSPYHGDFAMCGNVWFNEAGTRIYTPCGNTFRVRASQAQDMVYAGALELSSGDFYGFLIESLSQSDAADEIALIESDEYNCSIFPDEQPCITHLALYEADFLNHRVTYSIRPITVGDVDYQQRGLFVFHDAAGSRKFMVSRLTGLAEPADGYYLTVIE